MRLQALLLLSLASLVSPTLRAAEPTLTPQQLDFFEKKIRPLLSENCYKCHSHDSEKIKGGLLLDTRDGVLKGGDLLFDAFENKLTTSNALAKCSQDTLCAISCRSSTVAS